MTQSEEMIYRITFRYLKFETAGAAAGQRSDGPNYSKRQRKVRRFLGVERLVRKWTSMVLLRVTSMANGEA